MAPPSIIKKLPAEDTQPKPSADEQKRPENRSDAWALSDKIAVIASVAALLQFFALVGTVFVLIWTARRQLRAYVFVSSAKIIHGIEDDSIPEAHVVIKNSGQTPAYRLTNISGIAFDRYPAPPSLILTVPDRDYLSLVKTRMDLGPGNKTSPVTLAERPLTSTGQISLTSGTSAVWVYGEIRYRDVFWCKRRTKYRLMIGGPFGASGGQMVGCEEGNEAT